MAKACVLALALASPLAAGVFGWRLHEWARLKCQNGPEIQVWIRGEEWKLTAAERELLEDFARSLRNEQGRVFERRGKL